MPRCTYITPHATIPLDYIDGDLHEIAHGYRYEMAELCRKYHIPQRYITPYISRWGSGFVIQSNQNFDDNHVTLLTTDGTWMRLPLKAGAAQYKTLMRLDDYERLMQDIEADYPPGSITATLSATLKQILEIWANAKANGCNHLDLRVLDEIVAARLNPFVRSWLKQDTAEISYSA